MIEFEPNVYEGTILEAGLSESQKGVPYVWIKWDIDGRSRWTSWYDSGGATKYMHQKLAFLGFGGHFDDITFTVQAAQLRCTHEAYKDEMTERWDLATSGSDRDGAKPDTVAKMTAKWRQSPEGQAATPVPQVTAPAITATEYPAEPPVPEPVDPIARAKARAWESWSDVHSNETEAEVNDGWFALLEATHDGKQQADYTVADWEAVQFSASIPF